MDIGNIIKKCRIGSDMTQDELASKLNVSVQTISRWETGNNYPDITLLPKIAKCFNVSTDYLLGVNREKSNIKFISTKETFSADTKEELESFCIKHKKERGTPQTVYNISLRNDCYYLEIETHINCFMHELKYRGRKKRNGDSYK